MDTFGALILIGFALLLAFNQIVAKVANEGMHPFFFAGLRSVGAFFCLWAWLRFRGKRLHFAPGTRGAGVLIGLLFSAEFLFLFTALDLTTVTRISVIFYTMPVWLAVAAHFLLPGERLTPVKVAGLAVASLGVVWAIVDRQGSGGQGDLRGDLCALAASICWAGTALCARGTSLKTVDPVIQLVWQVGVSAPILLVAAWLSGPLLREPEWYHFAGLIFQTVTVVAIGFLAWFWLLTIYPAADVASFTFLTPVFGVFMGWLMLDEVVGPMVFGCVALVALGLVLINRAPRSSRPPRPG